MTKNIKRRRFIETSAKGMGAVGLLATTSFTSSKVGCLDKLFVHHVYFWLKEPENKQIRDKFEKALRELVTIETIVDYHLGIPAQTNREVIDTSYTYSLLVLFKNKADQDIYQPHPKHQKFIADCQDLWKKVVVYDSISI